MVSLSNHKNVVAYISFNKRRMTFISFGKRFGHPLNKLLMLFIVLFSFSACEEIIDVDLNEGAPKLVVQGWVYDTPGPYRIRLTLTTSYFDTAAAPKVTDALVIITENNTIVDTLKTTSPGIYKTQKITQGKVGATYSLKILYKNEVYDATATLKPVAPLDSLSYVFKEKTFNRDEGYYVTVHFQEPATTGDYYRWLYYRNEKLYKKKDEVYASDEFYNGNYIDFEFGYDVDLNDTVRIEMYSLEKGGYEYFRALDEQDNTGDLFDTPPGNVKGNISNGAIGYFGASGKTVKEIIIE
jgi:hypothetical protein